MANGLCFATTTSDCPPSLKNVYKSLLAYKHMGDMPKEHSLSAWARQGVLMLNCALTTLSGKAGAHVGAWRPITNGILAHYVSLKEPFPILAWGRVAQSMATKAANGQNWVKILHETHPSPISQATASPNFSSIDVFGKANKAIVSMGRTPIVWSLDGSLAPVEYYTDGSCVDNGKPSAVAGYAVIATKGPLTGSKIWGRLGLDAVAPSEGEEKEYWPTNIRAEGVAIHIVLRVERLRGGGPLTIWTDCQFWINAINEYIPTWVDSNGGAIEGAFVGHKNPDLSRAIWLLIEEIRGTGRTVEISHVKAHTGGTDRASILNDVADRLANQGRALEVGKIKYVKVKAP